MLPPLSGSFLGILIPNDASASNIPYEGTFNISNIISQILAIISFINNSLRYFRVALILNRFGMPPWIVPSPKVRIWT